MSTILPQVLNFAGPEEPQNPAILYTADGTDQPQNADLRLRIWRFSAQFASATGRKQTYRPPCIPASGSGTSPGEPERVVATGRKRARVSGLPGFGEFDFDPQFDFGEHGIETRIARREFQAAG